MALTNANKPLVIALLWSFNLHLLVFITTTQFDYSTYQRIPRNQPLVVYLRESTPAIAPPNFKKSAHPIKKLVADKPLSKARIKPVISQISELKPRYAIGPLPAWQGSMPAWMGGPGGSIDTSTYLKADTLQQGAIALTQPDLSLPNLPNVDPLAVADLYIDATGVVRRVDVVTTALDDSSALQLKVELGKMLFRAALRDGQRVASIKRITLSALPLAERMDGAVPQVIQQRLKASAATGSQLH